MLEPTWPAGHSEAVVVIVGEKTFNYEILSLINKVELDSKKPTCMIRMRERIVMANSVDLHNCAP